MDRPRSIYGRRNAELGAELPPFPRRQQESSEERDGHEHSALPECGLDRLKRQLARQGVPADGNAGRALPPEVELPCKRVELFMRKRLIWPWLGTATGGR